MTWLHEVVEDIAQHGAVVRVTVVRADGSTPREVGAAMLVGADAVRDTIGGGALELAAIAHARALLARRGSAKDDAEPARGSLSPPTSGLPQARPGHQGPEGGGERDGVRGSQGLQPSHGRSARRLGSAFPRTPVAERISLAAAPHPSPLPASGERGPGRRPFWARDVRDFPLGPSLGQCCGGFVRLLFEAFAAAERGHLSVLAASCHDAHALLLRPLGGGAPLQAVADRKEHRSQWPLPVTRVVREMLSGARPRAPVLVRGGKGEPGWFIEPASRTRHPLYIYGAGHVGRALVRVLQDLPFAATWVDTSADRFPEAIPPHAKPEITRDPAAFARNTASDAFHIVLTYSHALDLAICHGLLSRGDFRFLGLIGSQTKRARFVRRLSGLGIADGQLARLACPIGLPGIGGKEPAAIALSVAVQLLQLASEQAPSVGPTHAVQ